MEVTALLHTAKSLEISTATLDSIMASARLTLSGEGPGVPQQLVLLLWPEPGSLAMASARPTLSGGGRRQLPSLGLLLNSQKLTLCMWKISK